jgi:hypothetical protein
MKERSRDLRWWGAAIAIVLGAVLGTIAEACSSDGATPNCPPDGGDCLTPPTTPTSTSAADAGLD